ncbi:MAG TPA: thiolase family protein [Bacillota bacterium]|jgi:acetyl-CoA C-acetyltransferase|nr:thiolase family protein [Bacillota bacterium]HOB87211.1 thiolase family protein [Bacillota bacterium]HOP68508.1 thiolase family protein [Bacillota bacterium]HPT33263.1 thiolase family protein [Bacillota bacterium]HPZ65759.1 thiolase family protein [Bacillota bacterium]
MKEVGIIAWAHSEFSPRNEGMSRNELLYQVTKKVLEEAGMEIGQIDMVISASCDTVDGTSISNAYVVDEMGAYMKEESKVEEDGAYALAYAYYRLLTGQYNNCLVVSHGKISDSAPAFYTNMSCDPFLLRPLGLTGESAAALQARVYAHRFGATEEDFAAVAVKNRRLGSINPHTQLKSPVTLEEVLASPVVASPLRELTTAPVTDGAAAVIMATGEYARERGKDLVRVEGIGFSQDLYYPGNKDLSTSASAKAAAAMAYREAQVKDPLRELDFAEITEQHAFYELLLYEALGWCGPGEGRRLLAEGVTDREGEFPVNPSGGALCANPVMSAGLVRVVECCRQLTGTAEGYQLPKPVRRALAHACSGLFLQSNLAIILGI